MSRKDESKAKDAIVTVNIDDFTRTRDNVIVSLATLQSAVSDLSRAYINHANTVLNRGPVTVESSLSSGLAGGLATTLLENGLLGAGLPRHSSPPETTKPEVGDKKKRKRAPPDPNAPKRALTPYFLYMQHNRSQIASELGPQAKPKEVSDEGTKRWAEMPEDDKVVWKKLYADNLAVYKAKMAAYKAGLPLPDDDNAKADNQLQQSVAAAEAAAAEDDDSSSSSNEDESSAEEPAKEPTPPPSGKRRRVGPKAANNVSTPVSAKKASPEKKKTPAPKKTETKETKEIKEAKEPASTRKSLGASADGKPSKKKRKSDVGPKE